MAAGAGLSSVQLCSVCLIAEGFPPDFSPKQVADYIQRLDENGLELRKIAPVLSSTGQRRAWMVQLSSEEEQRKCRRQFKNVQLEWNGQVFKVRLSFPSVNDIPAPTVEWIVVDEEVVSEHLHPENVSSESFSAIHCQQGQNIGVHHLQTHRPSDNERHRLHRPPNERSGAAGHSPQEHGDHHRGQHFRSMSQLADRSQDLSLWYQEDDQHWAAKSSIQSSGSDSSLHERSIADPRVQPLDSCEYEQYAGPCANTQDDYTPRGRTQQALFHSPRSLSSESAVSQRYSPDGRRTQVHGQDSEHDNRFAWGPQQGATRQHPGRQITHSSKAHSRHGHQKRREGNESDRYTSSGGLAHGDGQFHQEPRGHSSQSCRGSRGWPMAGARSQDHTDMQLYETYSQRYHDLPPHSSSHGGGYDPQSGDSHRHGPQSQYVQTPSEHQRSVTKLNRQPGSYARRTNSATVDIEEQPLRTVAVTCDEGLQTEDIYINYFENARNGGGKVETWTLDEQEEVLFITFKDPEVASAVTEHRHEIGGKRVNVRKHRPPKPRPTYPDKLLLRNVPDSASKNHLETFLRLVAGQKPCEIIYGEEPGIVLATFSHEPDIAEVQRRCETEELENCKIQVFKVPISNCVMVENLNPNTTKESVLYFFESERNNGGHVQKVVMGKEDAQTCFVYFEDSDVVERVLGKRHEIDKTEVSVKRYMECLGPSGGSTDPGAFPTPKPVVVKDIDRYKFGFIKQCESARREFVQKLSHTFAAPRFADGNITVECTLTPDTPKGRVHARSWAQNVEQVIKDYMGQIDVHRTDVMQQIWPEVEKFITALSVSSDEVIVHSQREENAFVIVGMKGMPKQLSGQLAEEVRRIEQEMGRKKEEVADPISNLKSFQLRLLGAVSFDTEAQTLHKGLTVAVDMSENVITFHGLMPDIKAAQLKMYSLLQNVKSRATTTFTDTERCLLINPQARSFIEEKFRLAKLKAVWEVRENALEVYALSDADVGKAEAIIQQSMKQREVDLNAEASKVVISEGWQTRVTTLKDSHPGKLSIDFSPEGDRMIITATDDIIDAVSRDIDSFLENNTMYEKRFCFSPSRQKYVSLYCDKQLHEIRERLKAYKVTLSETGQTISVRGTKQGVDRAKNMLLNLEGQISCHVRKVCDPAHVKYLTSGKCRKELQTLGKNKQCVISLEPESSGLQEVGPYDNPPTGHPSVSADVAVEVEVELPGGITVCAVEEDITQMEVDVIVNAANGNMEHRAGLAGHIVDEGGQSIQLECHEILQTKGPGAVIPDGDVIMTKPGRLRCKSIIHAVGPRYKGGKANEAAVLHDTVITCLQTASRANYTSIALPAISTGVFGYPAADATGIIVEAVIVFLRSHRAHSIRAVYLCDIVTENVKLFSMAIHKFVPSSEDVSSIPLAAPQERHSPPPVTETDRDVSMTVVGAAAPQASITGPSIISGAIADQKVDVIVNSTSTDLALNQGAVSGSISAKAGSRLQDECRQSYPKGIKPGDVAKTKGHKLACQKVYHITLPTWGAGSEKGLESVVIKCLNEASNTGYSSIALPVLGTGKMAYPHDSVARAMLAAVFQFRQTTPASPLSDIRIVVYHTDKTIFTAFESESQKLFGAPSVPSPTKNTRRGRHFGFASPRESAPASAQGPSSWSSKGDAAFSIGGFTLIIKQGDITDQNTDLIVNSSNRDLDHSKGAVAQVLRRKCGAKLDQESKERVSEMARKGIALTEAYNLRCRSILHLDAVKYSNDGWEAGIQLCLQEADRLGAKSIAMPALGTGNYGQPPDLIAQNLFSAMNSVAKKCKRLQQVHVVMFDSHLLAPFVAAIAAQVAEKNKPKGGLFKRSSRAKDKEQTTRSATSTQGSPLPKEMNLYIYTVDGHRVQAVLKMLADMVEEKFYQKEIRNPAIQWLEMEKTEEIEQVGIRHEVDVQVQAATSKVILHGMHANVCDAMEEISNILQNTMYANMAQWYFLEVTQQAVERIEYPQEQNKLIEVAYQRKQKQARITDSEGVAYVIDFEDMIEYPEGQKSDTVMVIRRDKISDSGAYQCPSNWEPHSPNENLKLVEVKPDEREFKDVQKRFTVQKPISSVHRIQNMSLYQQYAAKKAQMDNQNKAGIGDNEKLLWHGTSSDALDNINMYGFNRSYCGKNATAHGEGVYFAVDPCYSARETYSPPEPVTGKRYMYLCKVLVGYPVKSKNGMRVLPTRTGVIKYDSATDNKDNPWMYVIFNDTQAYPEYLITFR